MIYLDHNATALPLAEVADVMSAILRVGGNPSSVHGPGREARRIVEAARASVGALVDVAPAQVIFTAGATEANNAALTACGRARALVSAIEHPAVLEARADAEIIPVTADGTVDLAALAGMLGEDARDAIVSVMTVNNETGVIQPVAEAAAIAHAAGALFHTDAVQAAGRIPLSLAAMGADMMSLSAHKIGGPQGVGALVVRDGLVLSKWARGGGQERSRRAGTENVAGIAGFGTAAAIALDRLEDFTARLAPLRDRLEAEISAHAPGLVFPGQAGRRVANTSVIALPGMAGETQVMALDLAGVAVSAGSACSSGKVRASHVLGAMGYGPEIAGAAIRVSLGPHSTDEDISGFVSAWKIMYDRYANSVRKTA